jgi:threonine dehydrogenase-like Zn-dependent dehydrogenase
MPKKFTITAPQIGIFEDESDPQPVEGQVLCQSICVGLCGTDRLIFAGDMPSAPFPRTPGHEVAALVISNNSRKDIKPGRVICIDPYKSCGDCSACRQGRYNCCRSNQTLGVQREGILREKFIIDADHAHLVPEGIEPSLFCLAEPLTLALHITQRAGDVQGLWCLVAGAGNVGGMVIRVLRTKGAKIIAWDKSEVRLKRSEVLGADVTVNSTDPSALQQVFDLTRGDGVSVAFETAGQSSVIEACIKLTAFAGKVVLVGHSKQVSNVYGSDIVFKELDILGSRNSLGQFPKAIEMLANNPILWQEMISHRFTFENTLEAFKLTQNTDVTYSKIVIDFPP